MLYMVHAQRYPHYSLAAPAAGRLFEPCDSLEKGLRTFVTAPISSPLDLSIAERTKKASSRASIPCMMGTANRSACAVVLSKVVYCVYM